MIVALAPSWTWARDSSEERQVLLRMFHYHDSMGLTQDSLWSNVYVRHQFNIEKRNPLLMCVPTLYHVSYGDERSFLSESFSTVSFFDGKVITSNRHIQISTIKRYRKTMPNLMPYLTPNLYQETIINENILSPFHYHNRFFYKYRVIIYPNETALVTIRPRTFNTQTVKGQALVCTRTGRVITTMLEGEYDMIHFNIDVIMGDEGLLSLIPKQCTLIARFSLLGNRLTARHQAIFNLPGVIPDTLVDSHDPALMATVRPDSLTEEQKEIYAQYEARMKKKEEERKQEKPSKPNFVKDVLWDIIGDNVVNRIKGNFGMDNRGSFRTSPLFNPLYMGYSDRRGVTYRFDARGAYTFNDNQDINTRVKLGYSFKQRQFYFYMPVTYTFDKAHGGFVTFEFGFGDRISNSLVAQHVLDLAQVDQWMEGKDIEDFKDSYFQIKGHYDISDHVGVSLGAVFHRRGALNKEAYHEVGLQSRYHSFSPNIELQLRPLGWRGPIITADYERGIKGMFKSDNNYERWEFDMSYILDLPCMRFLSLRAGGGFYSTAIDKYNFVDYTNFRENNIPGSWNDEWSGNFELLSRKMYNTSRYYLRSNITYESPLLALSWVPWIGHFIEKERMYVSVLKAERLKHYEELGYSFTNRLFSFGVFTAFSEGKYDSFGLRFGFELFSHW